MLEINLRDYQSEVVAQIQDRDMVVMPTGTGKSAVIAAVADKFRGNSVIIVVPTLELKSQLSAAMKRWGVPAEVAVWKSAQSLKHAVWLHDECHHSAAASWDKLIALNPGATHIGFTATPLRLDGRPLKGFSRLVEPHPIGWYMERGYLCPKLTEYTVDLGLGDWPAQSDLEEAFTRLDKKTVYGSVIENYKKLAPEKCRSVVFATTIAHSEKVSQAFRDAGVKSAVIHSGMKAADRRKLMEDFRSGEISQLVNVYILGEGIDVPDVNTVILLRPTESLAMYYQWVGRALRPGKNEATVLDFVGNLVRHGSVKHNQGWADEYAEAVERELIDNSYVCVCANCGEVLSYPGQRCPVCGHKVEKLVKGSQLPKEKQGMLKEFALSPFAQQIVRARKKASPIDGANMLIKNRRLFQPGDRALLMQYLSRWLDGGLVSYYYNEITK
jgi:superfamily II DNA or RNA helicase